MNKEKIALILKEILRDSFQIPDFYEINNYTSIRDLGLTSLDQVELIMDIEDKLNIKIPDEGLDKFNHFGEILLYLNSLLNNPKINKSNLENKINQLRHKEKMIKREYQKLEAELDTLRRSEIVKGYSENIWKRIKDCSEYIESKGYLYGHELTSELMKAVDEYFPNLSNEQENIITLRVIDVIERK